MPEHRHAQRLNVVRGHVAAAIHVGARLRSPEKRQRPSRARAQSDVTVLTRGRADREQVASDRWFHFDVAHGALNRGQILGAGDRFQLLFCSIALRDQRRVAASASGYPMPMRTKKRSSCASGSG